MQQIKSQRISKLFTIFGFLSAESHGHRCQVLFNKGRAKLLIQVLLNFKRLSVYYEKSMIAQMITETFALS